MKEWILDMLKRLPVDLGQGYYRHTTKAKLMAYSFIEDGAGRKALDIGCGDGYWSSRLKKKGWNVTSVDGYDSRYEGSVVVDAEKTLPFEDDAFDMVWMAEVLEHIENAEQIVDEFRRIIKPGGEIVLTTPNSDFWLYRVLKMFGITAKQVQNPDHKQFFDMNQMKQLFPRASIFGFFPYAILKLKISKLVGPLSPSFVVKEKI